MDTRRRGERRRYRERPEYPFRDRHGEWVTQNRRRLVDRRGSGVSVPGISDTPKPPPRPGGGDSLLLHHRDAVIHVPAERQEPFLLGRRRSCDLVIPQGHISREHALIIHRDGRFVLLDQSLNGTFLQGPGGEVRRVHAGEAVLQGSGYLSLGRPLGENGEDLVYFYCRTPLS